MYHSWKRLGWLLLALLLIPPGWSAARDAWLLIGATRDRFPEAKRILLRDVVRATNRIGEAEGLAPSVVRRGESGMIDLASPREDLARDLPACAGRVVTIVSGEPLHERYLKPNRQMMIDEARFRLVDERTDSIGLLATNACLPAGHALRAPVRQRVRRGHA
jgi:hypothetical protein